MKEGKESLRKKRLRKENMKKPLKVGVLKAFTDFLIARALREMEKGEKASNKVRNRRRDLSLHLGSCG